ncbi:MAG: translocation/assembly module TamB domain-containing protein [Elusimicrobia bacterium]|nr:translocation/assembly module TamB domain-containing protein [Elusimicrobiota bacterium]
MRRKKRTVSAAVIISGMIFLAVFIYVKSHKFTSYVKMLVKSEASKALGNPVEIDSINTDIFNQVVLKNVVVYDGNTSEKLIGISRVKIKYSFIKFIKKIKSLNSLIREITLYRPHFIVVRGEDGRISVKGLEKIAGSVSGEKGESFPPWKLNMSKGTAVIEQTQAGGAAHRIGDLDISISLGGYPEIHCVSSFEIDDIRGKVGVEAQYHALSGSFVSWVTLKNMDMGSMGKIKLGNREVMFTGGALSSNIRIEGNAEELRKTPSGMKLYGDVRIEDAESGIGRIRTARINVSPERLKIDKGVVELDGNDIGIDGEVVNYFSEPDILLYVKGSLLADQLLKRTGIKEVEGVLHVDGILRGRMTGLDASGKISMADGRISNYSVSDLNAYVACNKDNIKFSSSSVNLAGGRIIWEGVWERGGNISIKGKAQDLSMKELAGVGGIEGRITGDIDVRGRAASPEITADITAEDMTVMGKDFGQVSIKGGYGGSSVVFDGFTLDEKYSIGGSITLDREAKILRLREMYMKGTGESQLRLRGRVDYLQKKADIGIEAKKVDIEEIRGIKKKYPDSGGNFDFNGNIAVDNDVLSVKGNIGTRNFTVEDDSYTITCDFTANSGRKEAARIAISDLNMNDFLRGSMSLENNGSGYRLVTSSVSFISADLRKLLKIFRKDNIKVTGGSVSGFFTMAADKGAGEVKVSGLEIADVKAGDLEGMLIYSGGVLRIERMDISKDGGRADIKGSIFPSQDIEAEFSDYDLDGRKISASCSYSGNRTGRSSEDIYEFELGMSGLIIGTDTWPGLVLNGRYGKEELYTRLKLGDNIKGEVTRKKEGRRDIVESDIWFREMDIRKVAAVFGLNSEIEGRISGSLKIIGDSRDPLFILDSTIKDGRWLGIPISGSLDLETTSTDMKISNIKGKAGDRGYIEITGNVRDSVMNLLVKIEGLDSHLLQEKLRSIGDIYGIYNAKIALRGDYRNPSAELELSGENLTVDGLKLKKMELKAGYTKEKTSIKELNAVFDKGTVTFSDGEVDISTLKETRIDIKGNFRNLVIGPLTVLGSGGIGGSMGFDPFRLSIKFTPHNILLNRYSLRTDVDMEYENKILRLDARDGLKADISIGEGKIEIRDLRLEKREKSISAAVLYQKGDIEGSLKARNIEINDIIRLMNNPLDFRGSAALDIRFKKKGKELWSQGRVSLSNSTFKNINIEQIESNFSYEKGNLTLTDTYVRDPEYVDMDLAGRIGTDTDLEVSIGRLSLSILEHLSPEISKGRGYFSGRYHLKGSPKVPVINGSISMLGGKIDGRDILGKIRDIECSIYAEGSRLILKDLSANWKPGILKGGGYVDLAVRPLDVNLRLETEGKKGIAVKIPYLDIPQSTIFGRYLTLPSHGEPRGSIYLYRKDDYYYLKGDIVLNNTHFTYPPAKGSRETPASSFLDNLVLDIDLRAGESVWYENTYARVKISGESGMLNFKKYPGKPILINGELSSDQGEVTYFNREFSVKEAHLVFEDTVEYLTAVTSTDIQRKVDTGEWDDDVIQMVIPQGRIADIAPRFNSTRYTEKTTSEEAMELAIAGADMEDLNQAERNSLLRKELLRAIDANLTSPIVKNILKRTDLIDVAKVDVKVDEESPDSSMALKGAGLRIGRHVTDKLYMGYYMVFGGVENKLSLAHELDVLYRLQGSRFLRGRISEEEKFFLGFEQQIRF